MKEFIKKILKEPTLVGQDLDDPATTGLHANFIRNKVQLFRIYDQFYRTYKEVATRCPPGGLLIELGSGGGFAKEYLPSLITTDVMDVAGIDQVVDARNMPWPDASVSGIFMQNVLHHIQQPRLFFKEASRVLKPGGRILMIEPYHGWLSSKIRKRFHHEPYDEQTPDWTFESSGPLSGSNIALPWIIFFRDRDLFVREFPEFEVRTSLHNVFSYVLSGGISYRSLIPKSFMSIAFSMERALSPLNEVLAYFCNIELVKIPRA